MLSRKLQFLLLKNPEDLAQYDALIILGGGNLKFSCIADLRSRLAESTTIALLARLAGLSEPLKEFVKVKPVWGTCAGAILLSQAVENAKKGGQELLGGMTITIARNGWGSQVWMFYFGFLAPYIDRFQGGIV